MQNIQYISIQTGLGRGGGYRPHASNEVFAKSYGDCKDKANLMRAMLKGEPLTEKDSQTAEQFRQINQQNQKQSKQK